MRNLIPENHKMQQANSEQFLYPLSRKVDTDIFVIHCRAQLIIKRIEIYYFRRPLQAAYYVEVMCPSVCDTVTASNH